MHNTNFIPYFYIIQHKFSGRLYAGSSSSSKGHKTSNPQDFMTETGYTTSSRIVNYIIQEDGLESFKILRIKTFDTGWDAVNYETRFLIRVNAKGNTRFLNRSNNDGTFSTVGMTMTDATKKKISDANKGRKSSDEYREKMSKATAGTKNGMYGKTHSEETRKKISDKAKMRDPDSEETRKKKARHGKANGMYGKGHLISGENHFLYGKNHSDESKEKMRNHPSNKSVVVDGIEYISVSAAAKKLNVSRYIIDKLCKQQKGE